MAEGPYPKVPMHRFNYTKLSEAQIGQKLNAVAARGPTSASPLSDEFAGESLRIVTDDGPTLAYSFRDAKRLSVTEGDSRAVQAGYGALVLDHICLFAHLIPGTLRGYAVVIDRDTGLATVTEMWFGGVEDADREVMREIYHGYIVRAGQDAPAGRHVFTNRIEGRGYYWKRDTGYETLDYYPSIAYSHFVELNHQGGELGFSTPSDYIKIDEEFFIYTRTESEFAGIFTIYVVDPNRVEQIGLRLGFDAADNLDYSLFRGKGEWIGQIAQFEKFGDTAGGPMRPNPNSTGQRAGATPVNAKGARAVYRPLRTMPKMTEAEVDAAVAKNRRVFTPPSNQSGASGMAVNGTPPSAKLGGKRMTIRYDGGPTMEYRFDSAESLQWRKDGRGNWTQARYRAWESVPNVFIFGHLLDGEPNHDGHMTVIDLDNGLATCFNGYLNTPYYANEAGARTLFGTVETDGLTPPIHRRHQRTDELVGRALTWNYSPTVTSMHLYSTPHTTSWIIFTNTGAGGMEWSGPGDFVKIRDDLYFAYWLEEACNGTLGTILINMRTMHDAGIGYHCGPEGLSMSQVGAHARHAGRYDTARFFEPKTADKGGAKNRRDA